MSYNSKIPVEIKKPTSTGCKKLDSGVNAVHKKTQAPIEMIILNQLSAVAAATQARYKLKMPQGHYSNLSLFAIAVGGSGMRKSSVIDAGIQPITDFENEQKTINKNRKNHNNSDTTAFHANFLVVVAGNPSLRSNFDIKPKTDNVPTPVLSSDTVPSKRIVCIISFNCFIFFSIY